MSDIFELHEHYIEEPLRIMELKGIEKVIAILHWNADELYWSWAYGNEPHLMDVDVNER